MNGGTTGAVRVLLVALFLFEVLVVVKGAYTRCKFPYGKTARNSVDCPEEQPDENCNGNSNLKRDCKGEGPEKFCTFQRSNENSADFVINHIRGSDEYLCCSCEKKYGKDYGSAEIVDGDYCKDLFRDGATDGDAWTRPFTGFDEDGKQVEYHEFEHFCNNRGDDEKKPKYRMQPSTTKLEDKGSMNDYTNRLQFKDSTIAQEGISFCIIGTHYRKSYFSLWEPLKGFLPLAEKRFDIGNHIDPEDSSKMNIVELPKDVSKLLSKVGSVGGPEWTGLASEKHRFESVWLGLLEVNNRNPGNVKYGVELNRQFEKRPAHPDWQPDPSCKNPYKVEVTMIEVNGFKLHNHLHIKVYSDTSSTGRMCPTGRIKLLMLEVRDQDGLPVGQFTHDVTCDRDAKTINAPIKCPDTAKPCRKGFGTINNNVPCMFSRPESVVHPSIFMFSATDEMSSGGSDSGGSGGGGAAFVEPEACRNNQVKPDDRKPPTKDLKYKENKEEYVTEVHATWRYAQMDEGWASELHFATMIIEDEFPIQYYTSRLTHWDGASSSRACAYKRKFIKYDYCTGECESCGLFCHKWKDCFRKEKGYTCYYKNNDPPVDADCCYEYEWKDENYRLGRLQLALISSCVNDTYNINRPYGYSAQYTVLKPTINTRGGWGYFYKDYTPPEIVDCHVPIQYGPQFHYTHQDESKPDQLGKLPLRQTLSDFLRDKYILENGGKYEPPTHEGRGSDFGKTYELPDWHTIGMTKYTGKKDPGATEQIKIHWYLGTTPKSVIYKMFDSAHQDPIALQTEFDNQPSREYFGSRYIVPGGPPNRSPDLDALKKKPDGEGEHDHEMTMKQMIKNQNDKVRCPCAFFPTAPPPELATKTAVEIEGRSLHVINMLLAWVILVPFSFFVARFYKETYSRVFFLQEFWWYTMHVLSLATALLFTIGGIYALKIKRRLADEYVYVWTPSTKAHIFVGYGLLIFDVFHLMTGAWRVIDYEQRVIQICLHWLFGWLEYICAISCFITAAFMPSGMMSCTTLKIYCSFIAFQLIFTLCMEYHIRRVDLDMNLQPERAFLPPPMMRLFHRNAPKSKFRIKMLIVFLVGCFCFYLAMHIVMRKGEETSCFQAVAEGAVEITY